MNIVLISKRIGCSTSFSLERRGVWAVALLVLLGLPTLGGVGGYLLGRAQGESDAPVEVRNQMEAQKASIEEAKRIAQENLDALTLKLGQMQARVMRLDALGLRITEIAKLKDGEFDFSRLPAQGGPAAAAPAGQPVQFRDFMSLLDNLSRQLDDRGEQLQALESVLISRNVQADILPTMLPVKEGWITSRFGLRADPFTGHPEYHAGIDIAGKEGKEVLAAGSGVVTWVGEKFGYGSLIEITHGNGYVTRYGHNKELLVKVGTPIKKGQPIARIGSTGRSTGPHVHFEVLRDGRTVDPYSYLQASR